MNEGTLPQPRRRSLETLLLVGALAFVTFLAVYFLTQPKTPTPTTTTSANTVRASLPASFDSFVGTITNVNGNIVSVNFRGPSDQGQILERAYTITIGTGTKLTRVDSTTALTAKDLHPDQTVIIAADHDIAQATTFTATSIQLYQP